MPPPRRPAAARAVKAAAGGPSRGPRGGGGDGRTRPPGRYRGAHEVWQAEEDQQECGSEGRRGDGEPSEREASPGSTGVVLQVSRLVRLVDREDVLAGELVRLLGVN